MKKFEDLSQSELWSLRMEVCVNSLFVCDYENSYGFDANAVCDFFDGYYDFMWELAEEEHGEDVTHNFVMEKYDNEDTLWQWFNCYDDLSWIN